MTLTAGDGFLLGAAVAGLLWVPLGRASMLLLSRPLPRPWRPVLRYLAPGTLWRDIGRALRTGRWT